MDGTNTSKEKNCETVRCKEDNSNQSSPNDLSDSKVEEFCVDDNRIVDNTEVEFDDLLSSAGELGLYQIMLFFSTFPFYMFVVVAYYIQLFLTEVSPNHWCWIPELENLTDVERRSLAIPPDMSGRYGYSRCEAYKANWTEVLMTGLTPNESWPTTKCQYGWEFDKTEIPYPTITSELGWLCDKDSYQATAQSIFFVGSICGGIVIGLISDRFGRLAATLVSTMFGLVGGIATMFVSNFTEFAICRFVAGIAYDNCGIMFYLLILEYVAPRYRSLIGNVSFAIFYTISVTALPWVVLACGHWKTILLVTSLPFAAAILVPFVLPESPRWLLSRNRIEEAVEKVLSIGRINKKKVPPKLVEQFKQSVSRQRKEENAGNIVDLLKRPLLRNMFIGVCVVYATGALVFDGLIRSIGQLKFDFFISFSVISVTEFPAVFILAFIMDKIGRRWLVAVTMATTGVFSILSVFVSGDLESVMCAVVARFCMNMAYSTVMQWSAEMLPVSVRGFGVSMIHTVAFIGYLSAPMVSYLETYVYWLPLVLIGSIASFCGLIALTLPETAGKEMPVTFEDAERLIRQQTFWDIPCLSKKVQKDSGHVNENYE